MLGLAARLQPGLCTTGKLLFLQLHATILAACETFLCLHVSNDTAGACMPR